MARLLSGLSLFLLYCTAFAQSANPEAPAEMASPVTVIVFLVLFIGSCIAFVAYTWWRGKSRKGQSGE